MTPTKIESNSTQLDYRLLLTPGSQRITNKIAMWQLQFNKTGTIDAVPYLRFSIRGDWQSTTCRNLLIKCWKPLLVLLALGPTLAADSSDGQHGEVPNRSRDGTSACDISQSRISGEHHGVGRSNGTDLGVSRQQGNGSGEPDEFNVLLDGEVRRRQQVIAEIGEAGVMRLSATMGELP